MGLESMVFVEARKENFCDVVNKNREIDEKKIDSAKNSMVKNIFNISWEHYIPNGEEKRG